MTDTHTKKEIKAASAGKAIAAGVAGILAGGLAVGAAVLMSDKKNQKKVSDVLVGAKEKVTEFLDTVHPQPAVAKNVLKVESKA